MGTRMYTRVDRGMANSFFIYVVLLLLLYDDSAFDRRFYALLEVLMLW